MVWKDKSDRAERVPARVNHTLTAVPVDSVELSDMPGMGPPTEGQLCMFGGDDGTNPLRDTWMYDISTDVWDEPVIKLDAPTARSRHTAARHVQRFLTATSAAATAISRHAPLGGPLR